jgi:hypothetical protein
MVPIHESRRRMLVAATIVVFLATPSAAQDTRRQAPLNTEATAPASAANCDAANLRGCRRPGAPAPAEPGTRAPKESGGSVLVPIGIAALVGGIIAASTFKKGDRGAATAWDSEELLYKEGPQLPKMALPGEFAVEGFVRGGWPLVFNVGAPSGADMFVQVVLYGDTGKPKVYPLVPLPESAAHGVYARVDLPEEGWPEEPRRAWLHLTAVKDKQGVPITVYGVGAGHEAVGSVAISVDSFGPPTIRRGGIPRAADFLIRFHNQALFPRLDVQIVRQRPVRQGGYERKLFDSFDLLSLRQPASAPTVRGAWPEPQGKPPTPGTYDMSVVAFLAHGPWTIGFAPTALTVQ